MMKTLLCNKDSKRESLCKECKEKLAQGKLIELDVKVSRVLTKISRKYFFADVALRGVIDLKKQLILICSGNIGSLIGKHGKIIDEIAKEIGKKRVKVVSEEDDKKELIKRIIGDVRILGTSEVFKPDSKEYNMLIAKSDQKKMKLGLKEAQKIVSKLMGAKTTVSLV